MTIVIMLCKELPARDDNNVYFFCHQKWVARLPLLLFTLEDKDKISNYYVIMNLDDNYKFFFVHIIMKVKIKGSKML